MRENSFDPRSAVESILFLARRVNNPTLHEILKLRYFADKLHMSRYGFVASKDSYVAMEFGPVASKTYDLLKAARGERGRFIPANYPQLVAGTVVVAGDAVTALRDPDLDLLSPADIECMGEAVRLWGNMGFKERTDLSHDDAWKMGWQEAESRRKGQGEMPLTAIAGTLDNAEQVLEYMAA
ncbi:Panacea domain-containing protein [Rhodanobacter umsongensis]|uniref:Panacea domain-containing protein n=1 Tax=Rhodanobacter umsongensis TaxID=633153 RepID=A0ABW0JN12_9GAMM